MLLRKHIHLKEEVSAAVCNYFSIDPKIFYSKNAKPEIAHPRFVAWDILKNHYGLSSVTIAQMYNERHHTGILRGIARVDKLKLNEDRDKIIAYLIT